MNSGKTKLMLNRHSGKFKYLQWICLVTGKKYEMLGMDMGGLNSSSTGEVRYS